MRRRDGEAITLIAAAQAQWWRLIINRRRWRDARALFAENDRDHAIVAAAWKAMSPAEQEAATRSALRDAAVQCPSSSGSHTGASGS